MNDQPMARYDFITAQVFLAVGVYMIVEGVMLPGAGGFIEKGGEPGRVVIMLGAIVSVFALVLLVRSVIRRGYRWGGGAEGTAVDRGAVLRAALTIIGCSFYAVGLLGSTIAGWSVQYHQATALFIFTFIVLAEWSMASELGAKRWSWLQEKAPGLAGFLEAKFGFVGAGRAPFVWLMITAFIQAALVTWAITYLFEHEFYVKLP